MKFLKRLSYSHTLVWSHSSTTTHARIPIYTQYNVHKYIIMLWSATSGWLESTGRSWLKTIEIDHNLKRGKKWFSDLKEMDHNFFLMYWTSSDRWRNRIGLLFILENIPIYWTKDYTDILDKRHLYIGQETIPINWTIDYTDKLDKRLYLYIWQ